MKELTSLKFFLDDVGTFCSSQQEGQNRPKAAMTYVVGGDEGAVRSPDFPAGVAEPLKGLLWK